jgi:hypothetical protein
MHVRYNGKRGASLEEAMGLASGTNGATGSNSVGAVVNLSFYHTPAMDGYPDATLQVMGSQTNIRNFTWGNIHEGNNYVFGYLDRDGDGEWNPDLEPAGIGQFQPIKLGWGDVNNVEIGLSDDKAGYPRFSWLAAPNATQYVITNFTGQNVIRYMAVPRHYWHEGDWLNAGYYGVSTGAYAFAIFTNAMLGTYKGASGYIPAVTLGVPTVVTPHGFTYEYARNELKFAVDTNATAYRLQIAANTNAPILTTTNIVPYRDILRECKAFLPIYAGDNYVPVGSNYASAVWATNGQYWVRVQAFTPDFVSSYSPWRNINFSLKPPAQGGNSAISGDIYYFGKVARGYGAGQTNKLTMIIQAFESPGFSGMPDGQVQISTNCTNPSIGSSSAVNTNNLGSPNKGAYSMLGLYNKVYYVRAFIDLNGNRTLDSWEPVGFAKNVSDYLPMAVDCSGSVPVSQANVRVVIRDRDTDSDSLPDGWEWMYYGTMNRGPNDLGVQNLTYWGTTNMTLLRCYEVDPLDVDPTAVDGDTDHDGVTDFDEICYSDRIAETLPDVSHYEPYDPFINTTGTDLNPMQWDTDGDGLSDGFELANGLDPLNPNGDADADGVPDAEEVLSMMTSPRVASDVLRLQQVAAVTPGEGIFSLTWEGKAGVSYQVQYSDDLKVWNNVPDADAVATGIGVHAYTDKSPVDTIRFYRVVVR